MKAPPRQNAPERIATECLFSPVRLLQRVITSLYDEAVRDHGVRMTQLNVLVAIEMMRGEARPPQLGDVLRLEKSSLSRELVLLEKAGLVKRGPGRAPLLTVTAKGKDLLQDVLPAWEQAQERAIAILGTQQAAMLRRTVHRLRKPPA